MSEHRLSDDVLRQAFQSLAVPSARECDAEDLDRIWQALDHELPAAERRQLVERLSTDPALAEAWRVAHRLRRPAADAAPIEPPRVAPWWPAARFAAAAVLVLAVATGLVIRRGGSDADTFRNPASLAVESLVGEDPGLPRDAFRLRWSPGPQDSRYLVRVTTEDLRLLVIVEDLNEPELLVDSGLLADVPAGSRILWQVEVLLPGGERVVSSTHAVRIRPGR